MKTDIDNPEQDQSSSTPKHIFILSGQSNMSGRGGVKHQHWDGVVPLECQPHPSILRLSANLEWEQANEPLHYDIDTSKVCGVGPGMSFANALREQLGIECVGLVPCAVGGTAIKKWARGQNLYKTMVNRSKESINKSDGEIKALLWYQGESDTSSRHDAEAYKKNMEKLIQNVREDLGLPSLPVIQVAIATGEGKYVEKVREAQLGMNLPNVVCVDAKGLTLKEDNLHLTTESQAKLGQMLADAFCTLITAPSKSSSSLLDSTFQGKAKHCKCLMQMPSSFCSKLIMLGVAMMLFLAMYIYVFPSPLWRLKLNSESPNYEFDSHLQM